RFADDFGRIGNQCAAVHGDPAIGADKAGAAFAADLFARVRLPINRDAVGVFVTRAIVLQENFDRPGGIGAGGPLDDIVVVLAPIEFADIEAVRSRDTVEREPRRRPEIKVPIKAVRDWFGRAETLRPENSPAIAPGVNGLQLSD